MVLHFLAASTQLDGLAKITQSRLGTFGTKVEWTVSWEHESLKYVSTSRKRARFARSQSPPVEVIAQDPNPIMSERKLTTKIDANDKKRSG